MPTMHLCTLKLLLHTHIIPFRMLIRFRNVGYCPKPLWVKLPSFYFSIDHVLCWKKVYKSLWQQVLTAVTRWPMLVSTGVHSHSVHSCHIGHHGVGAGYEPDCWHCSHVSRNNPGSLGSGTLLYYKGQIHTEPLMYKVSQKWTDVDRIEVISC